MENQALVCAFLLDGKGGGMQIGWEEIQQWTPAQGILWVHLNYTDRTTIEWLEKLSGLDSITIDSMIMDESRPRTVVYPTGILVFLRGVNLNPGQDPEDMVSIRVWVDEHRIITTRKRRLLSIDTLKASIAAECGPKRSAEFLVMLTDALIDRMADVIEAVEQHVDQLEEQVMLEKSALLRQKIANCRHESIMLRRYLAPQREAIKRLCVEDVPFLVQMDQIYLRESLDRLVRYIEDLDLARDRAAVIQEELASRLSEQVGQRMYLLSIVAVIFLPLSFLTGLLGINVSGIPGAKYEGAFLIVCVILLLISAVILFVLRRKKWI